MDAEKLKEVLRLHRLWVDGEGGKRADVRGANLQGVDLRGADLRLANLQGANLQGANLREADLRRANLREADLRRANLRRAKLREAKLTGADLRGVDLRWADLSVAGLIVVELPIWTAYVQRTHTRIGCKYYNNDAWRAFSDDQIAEMDRRALDWWKQHKPLVLAAMEAVE